MAGASRAAIAAYLGDRQELDRAAQVFKGWLGDRASYAGFIYGSDLSWQFDPNNPVGVNPVGAMKGGHDIDGAMPEEMRRGASIAWPPVYTGYPWEGLQAAVVTAEILFRAGYDAYNWEDQALLRAVQWLYRNDFGAVGDDLWTPWLIDARYGTHFATDVAATHGKLMGWTAWTHQFVTQAPQFNSVSPGRGSVGTEVTLLGTGFSVVTDVRFNGAASPRVTFVSVHELRATVPVGATTGPISVTTTEGTVSSAATFTLLAEPRVLTTSATAMSYTENALATAIDLGLATSDADSLNYVSAAVAITGGFAARQDLLGFVNQNGITGSYNAAMGVLTFTGISSVANYQAALRSVMYVNTSENPSTADRTVTFLVNDGALNASAGRTITVIAVNDPPRLTPSASALSYTENNPATAIRPGLTTSDPDSPNYVGATVSITGGFASGQDVLGFTNQTGITGSYNAAAGVLTLTGTSSVANYQAVLRSVTYVNTSENPSTAKRTITILVNDGALNASAGRKIAVIAVNDPPLLPPSFSALSYTVNNPATAIRPGLTTSDPDSVNYVGATVSIVSGFASGQDVLSFVSQNGISATYNPGTGVLTLTGIASVANYQAALRSVTYVNTSENPSTANRVINFSVNDGTQSAGSERTITVTARNDAPTTTVTLQDGVNGYAGTIDTTINGAFPTSTLGSSATTVEANDNPDKGSLLRWELPSIPMGSIVQSASITLRVTNSTIATYQLYELLRSWTEGGATWNQSATGNGWGAAGAQQIGVDRAAVVLASFAPRATGFVTIDLNSDGIALVQKWIDTPSTNHGVTVQNYVTTTNDSVGFVSSEAITAANRPKLTFTYGP